MSDTEQYGGISRRTLVKSSAIGSLALAAGGLSLPFGMRTAAAAVQRAIQPAEEKVVWGACSVNCGSRCALQLHVKDDEVVWWSPIRPETIFMVSTRFVPVCVGVQSADGSIIRIA
ncbi:hypothetical protein OIPHN330_28660 [Citrobacter freundii]|mgnify:CR=1 FL=1|nr:hypothetical protein OIPHN330_28660 [Citrobacter freundii]BEJ40202.1 hypothetical protein OIPHN354_29140 [Citrobacter freundii]